MLFNVFELIYSTLFGNATNALIVTPVLLLAILIVNILK